MILAGDVGGTKTVLALYSAADSASKPAREQMFASKQFDSLETMISEFLAHRQESLKAACFGVAGPIVEGRCQTTNLPWLIEETRLARLLDIADVRLVNDVAAAAIGILHLPERQKLQLNPKADPRAAGTIAVVAAGTGLGEAILYRDGEGVYTAIASEGGHCDFAPNTEAESGLLAYLRSEYQGHVSYERIVSGPGLVKIYQYLWKSCFAKPLVDSSVIETNDEPSAMISELGITEKDPLCVEALTIFARIYGAEAGNLVLKCSALGGLFIGGGIAPKLLPVLRGGAFMEGFLDKGRLSKWLESIPVSIALNPNAALLGAARHAFDLSVPGES